MKLYVVPAAPNPTRVMLYIAEREAMGAQFDIEQVRVNTLKGQQNMPEHLARNRFGTIPVLELDDGRFLIESLGIIAFLEDLFPEGNLLGPDAVEAALARDFERTLELRVLMPLGQYVHATNSPFGAPPNPELAAQIEAAMPKAMGLIEERLSDGRDLLGGDRVSIADCTLQAGLQFARFGKAEVLDGYPLIQAWDQRYRERDAAKAVLKF